MNIFEYISNAITALNSSAVVKMLEKSLAEADTQENITTTIVINPDAKGSIKFGKMVSPIKTKRYEIDFLDLDEWDNFDYNEGLRGTFQIVEEMEQLAASVFAKIQKSNNLPLFDGFKYTFTDQIRVNSNTESGTRVSIDFPTNQQLICNYV